ncbi:hypothetical protein ACPV51_26355, partial [Vibrio astriarenae]
NARYTQFMASLGGINGVFHENDRIIVSKCNTFTAVKAGYICDKPRTEFFRYMDAANVDLKAFTERFYHKICSGHLAPVLDTLLYLQHETD